MNDGLRGDPPIVFSGSRVELHPEVLIGVSHPASFSLKAAGFQVRSVGMPKLNVT